MSASERLATQILLGMVWFVLIVLGGVAALAARQPAWLALTVVGMAAGATHLWWLTAADHWRGFRPPEGISFAPREAELPIVTDHHAIFGQGMARNVITGSGFVAFEMVHSGVRQWFYVVPLAGPTAAWHAKPAVSNSSTLAGRSGTDPAFRYQDLNTVPEPVRRILLSEPFAEVDVRATGDLLIATASGMGAVRFAEWQRREGALLRRIAAVLGQRQDKSPASLTQGDPTRNPWQPDAVAPEHEPVWKQPPKR